MLHSNEQRITSKVFFMLRLLQPRFLVDEISSKMDSETSRANAYRNPEDESRRSRRRISEHSLSSLASFLNSFGAFIVTDSNISSSYFGRTLWRQVKE